MKKSKGSFLFVVGLLLIAAALFITLNNLYEGRQAGKSAMEAVSRLEERIPRLKAIRESILPEKESLSPSYEVYEETEIPDYVLNPEMEMPVETIDGLDYIGVLLIPDLQLDLPVISEWSYYRLDIAPCRYEGSAYTGNLIIAAHNFYTHFGNLNNLQMGDRVSFIDVDGNVFRYEVILLESISSLGVEEMKQGDWDLTLFTCTIGGQSRVTVRCKLLEE